MSQGTMPRRRSTALTAAGMLFGAFMFFHPANDATGALEPVWTPVHLAWYLSYLLMLIGLPACAAGAVAGDRWLGRIGYGLAWLGVALSLPLANWDAFLVPYLAAHAPDMIKDVEEMSGEAPVVAFRGLVSAAIIGSSLGFILLGAALMRGGKWLSGPLLAVGMPLFWIGALVFSAGKLGNSITTVGAVIFGIGLVILGQDVASRPAAVPSTAA